MILLTQISTHNGNSLFMWDPGRQLFMAKAILVQSAITGDLGYSTSMWDNEGGTTGWR
jgi:hypothetical protein